MTLQPPERRLLTEAVKGRPLGVAGLDIDGDVTDATGSKVGGGVTYWDELQDKPAVIAAGGTAAAARNAIGAGTSNLAVGTAVTDAKPGNWTPSVTDIPMLPISRVTNLSQRLQELDDKEVVTSYEDLEDIPFDFRPAPHNHAAENISSGLLSPNRLPTGATLTVLYNGVAWPPRPTTRADVIVHWVDFDGDAPIPTGAVSNRDLVLRNL